MLKFIARMIALFCLINAAGAQENIPEVTAAENTRPIAPVVRDIKCPENIFGDTGICKTITVPESRAGLSERTLDIQVQILKAEGEDPVDDPIVYLDGGPGQSSASAVYQFMWQGELREKRDIIIVFQRGSAQSGTALCPKAGSAASLDFIKDTDTFGARTKTEEALAECYTELRKQGVSVFSYSNEENAFDIRDIRRALNIKQWNLWGVSYGTALAQEVMRIDLEGVRAVLLDSVVLLDESWSTESPKHFHRALNELEKICHARSRCNRFYPSFDSLLGEAFQSLEKEPMTLSKRFLQLLDEYGDKTYYNETFTLNAQNISASIFALLYDPETFSLVPALLNAIIDRDNRAVDAILQQKIALGDSSMFDYGAYFAIACGFPKDSESTFTNRAFIEGDLMSTVGICDRLGLRRGNETRPKMARSDIPTLLISGLYDPITPPANAVAAAKTLSNAKLITFQNASHGPSLTYCGGVIATAFFASPGEAPDASCAETELETRFPGKIFIAAGAARYDTDFDYGIAWGLEESGTMIALFFLISIFLFAKYQFAAANFAIRFSIIMAAILGICVLVLLWLIASVAYTNLTYEELRNTEIGFVPLGSSLFVWTPSLLVILAVITGLSVLAPRIRKSAPGLAPLGFLAALLSIWIGLDAVYAGIYPEMLASTFDKVKDVSFMETLFSHD